MKALKYIFTAAVAGLFAVACNEGIDSITPVAPGEDTEAPVVKINYPTGDITIPFTDEQTDIDFKFEVTDDIEVQQFTVTLNEQVIGEYSDFKDYRRVLETLSQTAVTIGDYSLVVTATDLSGKTTTENLDFVVTNKYIARYADEILYMPFEGGFYMNLLTETEATVVGTPAFAEGKIGQAYVGDSAAYLTLPGEEFHSNEFTAVFWMKVNATPDRAGILTMGPEDTANAGYPDKQNNRKSGFRFFREDAAGKQRFKLNVGNGEADLWVDGASAADVDPTTGEWVHLAFTISDTECAIYINGEVAKQVAFTGIDWTGCDVLSIMSGAPRFNEWGHNSDESAMDELRLFNKALSQAQIQNIMGNEK
ncbi:LamG domain-containing protein [uncultured Sunxiuqinia sp.]|uniref:LamG domain-containing protein n=1 Tax=uncultured Sunxiuqinia sp. TaxID=1573825 RepID=UPI00261FB30E|nr:LamG domain-containing protein [uncultured Sunxiuqinia sp.]